jgi:hypothetical protein
MSANRHVLFQERPISADSANRIGILLDSIDRILKREQEEAQAKANREGERIAAFPGLPPELRWRVMVLGASVEDLNFWIRRDDQDGGQWYTLTEPCSSTAPCSPSSSSPSCSSSGATAWPSPHGRHVRPARGPDARRVLPPGQGNRRRLTPLCAAGSRPGPRGRDRGRARAVDVDRLRKEPAVSDFTTNRSASCGLADGRLPKRARRRWHRRSKGAQSARTG